MSLHISAALVSVTDAKNKASEYLTTSVYAGKRMAPNATTPVLIKTEMGDINKSTPVYYIFNTATTFVIVSGDDRAEEVLAYGDKPLDLNRIPENMQVWLDGYKEQLDWLISNPDAKVSKPSAARGPVLKASSVSPLLTAIWDQEAPFWNQCKFTRNGTTYQCLTGCPATSASMVLYYWKWPVGQVDAIASYTSTLELSTYQSVNFTYPALPATTFDWDNMIDDYTGNYTTAQGNAVATLMRYVGQAEKMMYGTSSAGGSGIYTTDSQVIADMYIRFGYDPSTCRVVQKSSYSEANWAALIQEELEAKRPIVYLAVSSTAGGHAFNVDGYNASTNKYHINWGWSGDGNTYCSMNAFSDGYYTFNQGQHMVIGIQPLASGPTIKVSSSSLAMNCNVGSTTSATFTLSGANLTGNVTATLTDGNGVFAVSPTTISAADATAGKTITITFTPTDATQVNGTIKFSSPGADDVTVTLVGEGIFETPIMQPADENFVKHTSFRADWTHNAPSQKVKSYTLEVNGNGFEPEFNLLDQFNMNDLTAQTDGEGYLTNVASSASSFLPDGWSISNYLYVSDGYILIREQNSASSNLKSSTFTLPEGCDKITVVVEAAGYNNNGIVTGLTVATVNGKSSQTLTFDELSTWYQCIYVLDAGTTDQVTFNPYTTSSSYWAYTYIGDIKIYVGDVSDKLTESSQHKAAIETGDEAYRLIEGITDVNYVVANLLAGGTYSYRVKALYTNGTESNWSNVETVTLNAEEDPTDTLLGDVNNDGNVDVDDVNALIAIILGKEQADAYGTRAYITDDDTIDVDDVNAVIAIILGK